MISAVSASVRGTAATQALAQPSVPRPLPGSRPLGAGRWSTPGSPAEVFRGYAATSAPVPPGSTVWQQSDAVLRIDSPMRESAILVTESGSGSAYTIAGSPTLQLQGGGVVADVDAFVRVAAAALDPTGLGFVAEVELDAAPWVVAVLPDLSDGSADPTQTLRLFLSPGALPSSTKDLDYGATALQGPCQAVIEAGAVTATATIAGQAVVVRARITDALLSIMPPVPATLTVSKKWGRHGSRPRLEGKGFASGERVSLRLGERTMSGTTADDGGTFRKGLQVPKDSPIGHSEFRATGARSGVVVTVPYEVRPPK